MIEFTCPIHGPARTNTWGCPDCVADGRCEIGRLRAEVERLTAERDALRKRIAGLADKHARFAARNYDDWANAHAVFSDELRALVRSVEDAK